MQKERKVKVTFLNEVSNEEALNMLAKDIANYIYNQKQKSKGSWIKKIKSKIKIPKLYERRWTKDGTSRIIFNFKW